MKSFLFSAFVIICPFLLCAQKASQDNNIPCLDSPKWAYHTNQNTSIICPFEDAYVYDSIVIRKTGSYLADCTHEILYALNKKTGSLIWIHNLINTATNISYSSNSFNFNGLVKFYTSNVIYAYMDSIFCYNIYTGKKKWTYMDPMHNCNDLYIKDSVLYSISNHPGLSITSLDIVSGKVLEKSKENFDGRNIKYAFKKGKVLITGDSSLVCYDLAKNHLLWRLPLIDPPNMFQEYRHDTAIGYDLIFAKNDTGYFVRSTISKKGKYEEQAIVCMNLSMGKIISLYYINDKTQKINDNVLEGIIPSKSSLYVFYKKYINSDDTLPILHVSKIIMKDLKKMWDYYSPDSTSIYKNMYSFNLVADSDRFYYLIDNMVHCLDENTGGAIWEKKLIQGSVILEFMVTKNKIFVTGAIPRVSYFASIFNKNSPQEFNFEKISWSPKVLLSEQPDILYISDIRNSRPTFLKIEVK